MRFEDNEFFFHYTTREAAFEHILPARQLRFSPYTAMRDPLENKRWRFAGALRGELSSGSGAAADSDEAAAWFAFDRAANAIRSSAKLLSLTMDAERRRGQPDWSRRGWTHARMWEQYAEDHAGVCLVFRREELGLAIRDSLRAQHLAWPYNQAVDYDDPSVGRLRVIDLAALTGRVTDEIVARFVEDHRVPLFYLKAPDWQTEVEYRFVVTAPDHDYVFADFGDALHAVVVGEKFPRWQHAAAIAACKHARAQPGRLDWSMGHPVLQVLTAAAAVPRKEAAFRIGAAFPADSVVARFVTVVAMMTNDWLRLLTLMPEGDDHDDIGLRMMMFRQQASLYYEAARFCVSTRRHFAEVRDFVDGLDDDAKEAFAHIVGGIDRRSPHFVGDWLKDHRNVTFHYPGMHPDKAAHDNEEVMQALRDAADLEGTISEAATPDSMRFGFADEVVVQWLPTDNRAQHVAQLRDAIVALGSFAGRAVRAYMATRPVGTFSPR